MKKYLRLFATGFGMGTADIIPGVSGGTIAFIFGIYEELLVTIKKLSGETLKLFLKFKIKEAFKTIPFGFLLPLGLGLISAILLLANLLEHLLETQPVFVWSFFFGLVAASILIVRKRVVTWDKHDIFAFLLTAIAAYILVGLTPSHTPETPLLFFFSGAIAIMAMILPGISGSFILVLLGKYKQILSAVTNFEVFTVLLVALGAVVGLAFFSRFLTWLFAKHHDITVAALTGFMLGSLRKIWPWKAGEANIFPEINFEIIAPLILMLIAAYGMIYLERLQVVTEQVKDIKDKSFEAEHKKSLSSQKKHKI